MSTQSESYVDQFKALDQPEQLLLGGIAVVIVSAFLPWHSGAGGSIGLAGDGFLTLLLAAGVAAGVHYEGWTEQVMLVATLAGGIVALVALASYDGFASIGLFTTVAGGAGMVAGGYQLWDEHQ